MNDRLRDCSQTVGIAMSGGLDSCSVAALAHRQMKQKDSDMVAYSYAFDRLKDCDERAYSGVMARELGIEIEYVDAESRWLLGDPEAFQPSFETPFMGWETTGREILSRLRARGGSVLLTGHGGDNLLTGSPLVYLEALRRGHLGVLREMARHAGGAGIPLLRLFLSMVVRPCLPTSVNTSLQRLAGRRLESPLPAWIRRDFVRRSGVEERLRTEPLSRPWRDGPQRAIRKNLVALGGIRRAVCWYDRVAAGFGIETRHPYLDRRLVELVASLPPSLLYQAGQGKRILREAMKGILPEKIRLRQGKTSFVSFIDYSLRERAAPVLDHLFQNMISAEWGFVDERKLRYMYNGLQAGNSVAGGGFALGSRPLSSCG